MELSSGGESTESLTGKLNFEQSKNRIIGREDDNLPRLLIVGDGVDFVMKISRPGIDVLTASDDDLIFNSNNNIFKIIKTGTLTVPILGSGSSTQVFQNTGIAATVPKLIFGSVLLGTNAYTMPAKINNTEYRLWTEISGGQLLAGVTAANVSGGAPATNVYYYIMQETAVLP